MDLDFRQLGQGFGGKQLLWRSCAHLAFSAPEKSALWSKTCYWMTALIGCVAVLFFTAWFLPHNLGYVTGSLMSGFFVAGMVLRLLAIGAWPDARGRQSDAAARSTVPRHIESLPVYTILLPLKDEADSVPGLVGSLEKLDYPKDRLDIKFILEADDTATLDALRVRGFVIDRDIIVTPEGGPRTKPNACTYALTQARGAYTVIYDAEDRPEPGQLRAALDVFNRGEVTLACVQARLSVDNERENWLTRHFAFEYAFLFGALLPFLSHYDLPMPLGGTSNHFRTDILRAIGGWDPYNVTEDADIGLRLAQYGFSVTTLASETREEAPEFLDLWIRQRTRWLKGYMQVTGLVMGQFSRIVRRLGFLKVCVVVLLVPGFLVGVFSHLLLWISVLTNVLIHGTLFPPAVSPFMQVLYMGVAAFAYAMAFIYAFVLCLHKQALWPLRTALSAPFYWLLLCWPFFRAVLQLYKNPFVWEKTPHGQTRIKRL